MFSFLFFCFFIFLCLTTSDDFTPSPPGVPPAVRWIDKLLLPFSRSSSDMSDITNPVFKLTFVHHQRSLSTT